MQIMRIMIIVCQITAFLQTLEPQDSARHKGHFALYNCLVLGHTKYMGVQRIYCNPFPAKPFYGSHRKQFGMLEYCFCSQPLLKQTLGPSPSTVPCVDDGNIRWSWKCLLCVLYVLYVLCILNLLFSISNPSISNFFTILTNHILILVDHSYLQSDGADI